MSTFFVADLHLGHVSMSVKRGFKSVTEHDEYIVSQWNKVVNKRDKVFILGDVTMETSKYQILGRLNGLLHVVLGNHDKYNHVKTLLQYAEQVSGMVNYKGYWLTHFPVHNRELSFRVKGNIHGHLHEYNVLGFNNLPDTRYVNVSCEQNNYTPQKLEHLWRI